MVWQISFLCFLAVSAHLEPEQIHLAFAGQDASGYPSGMTVSWFTRSEPKDSTVQYGVSASQLDQSTTGHVKHYMANEGFHSHAEILGLKPSTKYFYRVGSAHDSKWSEVFSFTSASRDAEGRISLAIFGDMGYESSEERPMVITLHGLEKKWSAKESRETLEKWKDEKSIDFIWHLGDIGYMDDSYAHSPVRFTYETAYNGYMNWLQNLTSSMAYMVTAGNHESECHSPVCVVDPFLGRALMNFTAYNHRWHMPSRSSAGRANMWYSFNVGPIHFVALNTETDFPGAEESKTGDGHISWLKAGHFGAEGEYLRWLEADLKAARAAGKKWIVAGGHRPLMRLKHSGMIELLEKYEVDFYFAGHAHRYWRDPPSGDINASSSFYKDPKGYIQIVSGGAGCDEMAYKVAPQCSAGEACVPSEHKADDPERTSELNPVYATDVLSMGRLNVVNSTTMHFELVDSKHGQILDQIWVTKTAKVSTYLV
ncbi:unnamed protein product [Durusdinium trenchii]|uniref:Acid phosphatase type 7 (Purple acid phosphatase long form) n=2 Tax=Durusdinium trenchii TaxID=1381693 RepID=A0ABP0LB64_9DINO